MSKGGTLSTCIQMQNTKKKKEGPLEILRSFEKSLTKRQKEAGNAMLCNGFVCHVRGLGCVQNQVLSAQKVVLTE